ncbi:hypothetical protein V8F44DRAFT_632166 [Aspergillus fumigatus]
MELSAGSSSKATQSTTSQASFNSGDVTFATLVRAVEVGREALQRGIARAQYLVYISVPLEKSRVNKITYSNNIGALIIKVMPNPEHEMAAQNFRFAYQRDADRIAPNGPSQQRAEFGLVVEIGLGWSETPSSTVKLVVTVSIGRTLPEVVFRRWELAPSIASTTRLYRVKNTTSVTGGQLLVGHIILSEQKHGRIMLRDSVWVRQGFKRNKHGQVWQFGCGLFITKALVLVWMKTSPLLTLKSY